MICRPYRKARVVVSFPGQNPQRCDDYIIEYEGQQISVRQLSYKLGEWLSVGDEPLT